MERVRRPSAKEQASRQDGTTRHDSGEQQRCNEGSNFDSTNGQDDNERGVRKEIRSKYRDLIDSVHRELVTLEEAALFVLVLNACSFFYRRK